MVQENLRDWKHAQELDLEQKCHPFTNLGLRKSVWKLYSYSAIFMATDCITIFIFSKNNTKTLFEM